MTLKLAYEAQIKTGTLINMSGGIGLLPLMSNNELRAKTEQSEAAIEQE